MILTNARIGAGEAERIGLVTRTVDDADLVAEAKQVADSLVAGPTAAIGAARRLLRDGATATLEADLDAEATTIALAGDHPESREGVTAFLARRKHLFL